MQTPLHECLELTGSCIALAVAMLIWLHAEHEGWSEHLLCVAAALMTMGLVDGAHAVAPFGAAWSWLRHGATLVGGSLFALVWLPLPACVLRRKQSFILLLMALALLGSAAVWWHPDWLPVPLGSAGYTLAAEATNAAGGLGFLAAAVFFFRRYLRRPSTKDLVFGGHTLLFATSAMLFGFSHVWAADWWAWHGYRLLAYGIVLVAAYEVVVTLYQRIARHAQELERYVEVRTAELRRLAAIVESSDDAIFSKSLDGVIATWNEGAVRLYGYTAAEAIGQPLTLVVPPELYKEVRDLLARVGSGEPVKHYETVRLRKDGRRVEVSVTLSPIKDQHGEITGASAITRDITQQKRTGEALRQSQARFSLLSENLPEFVWTCQPDGRCDYLNFRWVEYTGVPEAEQLGYGWLDRLHPDDREPTMKAWQRAVERDAPFDIDFRIREREGNYRWFKTRAVALRNEDGGVVKWFGTSNDIDDLRRTQSALAESKRRLELAQKAGGIGTWDWLIPTGELIWTPELEALYGLPPGGFGCTYEHWRRTVHPDDLERIEQDLQRTVESKTEFDSEFRIVWPDKSIHWITARGSLVCDDRGRPMRMVGINVDVTEGKRAEEELLRASAYNRSLIEASLDPLVTIAPDGTITDVNHATEEVTGRLREELIGADFSNYFTDPERARRGYEQVFREGSVQDYELEIHGRDGRTTPVLYNASTYRDDGGSVVGVFAAARNITDRKRAEQEIKELNAGLERLVAERTADLVAVNQELESFNYSVSHDLRAPLRHIDGFSKILLDEHGTDVPEEARRYIERIRESTRRMGCMVDELLELSRTSRREPSKQLTGLGSLVADVIAELKAEVQDREIEWSIGDLPFADCDPTLVRQVFANLLSNAVKFSGPRKPAVIEVGQILSEGQAVLFVRDNGVGFSMKYAGKLFGVFQRLHRREDFEGTGVGLVTVQRIIHKHGGRIWAEAELDKGATFYFTLEAPRPQPEPPNVERTTVSIGEN